MLRAADYAEDFQLLASQYAMLTLQDDQFTEQGRQDRLLDALLTCRRQGNTLQTQRWWQQLCLERAVQRTALRKSSRRAICSRTIRKSVIIDAQDPRSGPHSFCCDTSLTRTLINTFCCHLRGSDNTQPSVVLDPKNLTTSFPTKTCTACLPTSDAVYRDPSMRQLVAFVGGLDLWRWAL